jgi:hypothetical protein
MVAKQIINAEISLSLGLQDTLNISEYRKKQIIDYIKIASKGPEDLCDLFKEIPLNFKENDRYFAIYIISQFVVHHYDKFKKEKYEEFLDKMWHTSAECFGFDLDNLLDILSAFLKKDALTEIIKGPFQENEKIVLLFLFYTSMLGTIRRR